LDDERLLDPPIDSVPLAVPGGTGDVLLATPKQGRAAAAAAAELVSQLANVASRDGARLAVERDRPCIRALRERRRAAGKLVTDRE
jgi:hypothetical protein